MRMVQVAQRAEDLERAAAFYADLLGAAPTASYDPPGLVFFDLDGVRLLLDRGAPSALLYLDVDDIDATVARLRGAGVAVESDPARDLRPRRRHPRAGRHRRVAGVRARHRGQPGRTRRAASARLIPAARQNAAMTTGAARRPQVVAHRGSSHERAEHTLDAYLAALDEGADALECDVRLTADGHLVCVHDRDLRRTAAEPGRGVDDGARRARRARLRVVEEPVGRARRRRARPRPEPGQGAHAAPAARDRRRPRPPGRGGDRDQAPDAVRRPGRAPPGRDAPRVRLGPGRHARCG